MDQHRIVQLLFASHGKFAYKSMRNDPSLSLKEKAALQLWVFDGYIKTGGFSYWKDKKFNTMDLNDILFYFEKAMIQNIEYATLVYTLLLQFISILEAEGECEEEECSCEGRNIQCPRCEGTEYIFDRMIQLQYREISDIYNLYDFTKMYETIFKRFDETIINS